MTTTKKQLADVRFLSAHDEDRWCHSSSANYSVSWLRVCDQMNLPTVAVRLLSRAQRRGWVRSFRITESGGLEYVPHWDALRCQIKNLEHALSRIPTARRW